MLREIRLGPEPLPQVPRGQEQLIPWQSAPPTRDYRFPTVPDSWFYCASADELDRGPVPIQLPARTLVCFRTKAGNVAVLDARCCHAGSNLVNGRVEGETLRCPLHGWAYAANGRCVHIPSATQEIPGWARQRSYPVVEAAGHYFFFHGTQPLFPFPFFRDIPSEELVSAGGFDLLVDAPWHVVAANGFDFQHFRVSHDRVLRGDPLVTSEHPFCRRIVANFGVAGSTWRDRLTRAFAGSSVRLDVTVWSGNLTFTIAQFKRTSTYGLLCVQPLPGDKCVARVIVFVPRSQSGLGRMLLDPCRARLKRNFVKHFLQSDVERIGGVHFHPGRLIAADRLLREYLEWLENTINKRETE